MLNSKVFDDDLRRNMEQRREMIKRWDIRTHDDGDWSREQNRLLNTQLQLTNDMAAAGDTDPVRFAAARDRLRDQ
ncbi:hypothetical protein BDK88_3539 [Natrinema hispanicum]|uniref:Uncharacterized protein n=1 Tax=Natrinema hispanicum TaxID=392421 RepID=A0A482Y8M7_9EURY|nr:hypothetical protein [Natrinema hispanicum]RZV06526.1 hypothetical protein BDK88_3539 [Natrinema hispanicum]